MSVCSAAIMANAHFDVCKGEGTFIPARTFNCSLLQVMIACVIIIHVN